MPVLTLARRSRVAVLTVALLTGACASVPNLGPKPVPQTADSYAASATLAGAPADWPGSDWFARYGDAQLAQLIQEARAGSPDLTAAAARMRTAQAFVQRAGAALKPQIDAVGRGQVALDSKHSEVPAALIPGGWNDSGMVGIGASLDLDLWGKNRAALRAAKADAAAARYELHEADLALTTGIASAYADLAALYARRDSLASALEICGKTAALVRQRVEVGLDNQAPLRQAEALVSQTKADIEATDEAIQLTKNALAALAGAGPDRALSIARPNLSALSTQALPANASIDLIGRRPDIAAAKARVEAAGERIRVAKADFYPNVNLSALIGFQSFGLDHLFASSSNFGAVGPAVSLPLFHGGALEGQYRATRGQYDEAVALYDSTVVKALRETADAVTSQRMLARRLSESQSALASYQDAHRLARQRYEHGLATYLDVLSAEQGVVNAQLNVAQLEARAFSLDVSLVRALGGGFSA